jgi:hypothetical protein
VSALTLPKERNLYLFELLVAGCNIEYNHVAFINCVGFECFTVAVMKSSTLWSITQCRPLKVHRLGKALPSSSVPKTKFFYIFFYLQDANMKKATRIICLNLEDRSNISPETLIFIELQRVSLQKIDLFTK